MKPQWVLIALLLSLSLLAACTTPPAPETGAVTFDDPFAYCAAVGTIDAPDARYTGAQPPAAVVAGLRAAFDAPADAPAEFFEQGAVWRCAEGQVKACFVGANLPCQEKADPSETPNAGTIAFCQENPNAEVAPAAATGRATLFTWSCVDGAPVRGEQVAQADAQGFIADFWYLIEPTAAVTAAVAPTAALEPTAAATVVVAPTVALEPTAAATVAVAPAGAFVPLPADDCMALKVAAERALGVPFTMAEAPFFDDLSQEGGSGCQLTTSGAGADFGSLMTVGDALSTAFVGWTEDMLHAAGGPTGMHIGMTRDDALLLISVRWTPDPAVNCPDDQPISACELTPEQQLYTVVVQAATR